MGASALPSYGPIFEYADSGLTAFRAVENAQGELVDAVVLDANPAQAALSGCERAALRGRHLDAWFPGFDSAVLLGHARACRAAAAPVSFSQSLSDGRTFRGKVYWEGPQTFYLSLDEVRPLAPAGDDLSAVVPAGVLRVNTDGYVVEMMGFFDKLGFNILNAHLARTCQEAGFVDEHGSTVDEESCPVMRCLRDGVGLEEFLRGFPHPDGEMGWLRCSILIANNAKGEREALVTVQDITAEKRWADRLREIVEGVSANVGQRFFQSLVEHLARSLHADFALVGELVNEGPSVRCQAVFADGRQQDPFQYLLKGTPCSEVIAGTLCLFPNGVQQQFPHDTMLADLGVQAYVGVRLEGANGRPLGLIAVMFRRPLPDPDAARATLRIFAARAAAELERQHAEQELADSRARAEAANLAKSQFLATVSHEIRTPMHAIVGISELLAGTSMDAQQRQDFEVIQHAARQLLQLINDLLDFSRIESGRLETESIPFTPLELLRESLALVAPEADRKHLACRLEADPQLPELVSGDGQRIRQVLVNLLANAVKFTLRGSVVLACMVRQRSAESVRLRFEVTDTGIGIATESQATLFEPFVQADASFTRRFGGSGLGLAISHRLVELMGGEIGFHSAPEQGSTFWFEIPLATAASTRETPALPQSAPLPWAPARLLLAEDNAINQMVAIRLLRKLGIEAVVAANGREAVELARAERFDVILMDCQMPEKDGFAATQEIRAGGPSRGAAIIALTANALRGERDRCLASGMNDYISKPVSLDALRLVLGRWLLEQASFQA